MLRVINKITKEHGKDIHMAISEFWYEADGSIAIPLIDSNVNELGTVWFRQDEKLKQLEQEYLSSYIELDKDMPLRQSEQRELFTIKNEIFDYFRVYLKQENVLKVELL